MESDPENDINVYEDDDGDDGDDLVAPVAAIQLEPHGEDQPFEVASQVPLNIPLIDPPVPPNLEEQNRDMRERNYPLMSLGNYSNRTLLLRHASQNSLDESSQPNLPNTDASLRTFRYSNKQHFNQAFDNISVMRNNSMLCDVTLVAEDVEVSAHKMILAACCQYFQAMFSGFKESKEDRILLKDIDGMALELLVDYIYTAEITITEENVQTLLPAANILQLTYVSEACCEFLESELHPTSCLGIRAFADLYGCHELVNKSDVYVEAHFAEVVECEEFLSLDHEQVNRLISSETLQTPTEEKVYESVIRWVSFDVTARQQYLPNLIANVKLPFLKQDYLIQKVEEEPLIKSSALCKDYLIEALKYHLLSAEQRITFITPRTKPRLPIGVPKVLLIVGGQSPKAVRSVECYDFKTEKWSPVAEMPTRRCRCGLVVVGGKVYAVGGFNGSLRVRTVDVYDPTTDSWSSCGSMEARRSTLGVAAIRGKIYAVGGFDGTSGLNSAEVYDPKKFEWSIISPMRIKRSSVGVGVVKGELYAVGGYDGTSGQCLSSVEKYCPDTDTWSTVAEMTSQRSGAGIGVINDKLYVVGGHDGPVVRQSVEVYDPVTDRWSGLSDMNRCRRNAGVIAVDGLLYVVGGDDGMSNLMSVEVYNPEDDTWTLLPGKLSIGRSYAGLAVVEKPTSNC